MTDLPEQTVKVPLVVVGNGTDDLLDRPMPPDLVSWADREGFSISVADPDVDSVLDKPMVRIIKVPLEQDLTEYFRPGIFGVVDLASNDGQSDTSLWSMLPDARDWFGILTSQHVLDWPWVDNISAYLRDFHGVADVLLIDIATVLRELLSNAVIHGNYGLSGNELGGMEYFVERADEIRRMSEDPVLGKKLVSIGVTVTRDEICLSVRDQGAGFEHNPRDEAIEPGSPARGLTAGRGLAIAERLSDSFEVHNDNQSVVVRFNRHLSGPGRHENELSFQQLQESVLLDVKKRSILLWDGDESQCSMVLDVLRDNGFETISTTGDENVFWNHIGTFGPDAIVLTGGSNTARTLHFAQRLRKDTRYRNIPLLIITEGDERPVYSQLQHRRLFAVIRRVFISEDLVSHLIAYLERDLIISELHGFRQRISDELDLARNMQLDLLPTPAEIRGLSNSFDVRISSFYKPSSELGGDIWGLVDLANQGFAVFLIDFSGHGVGAAMNTFRLNTLINGSKQTLNNPALLLGLLNRNLVALLPRGQFATMFYAIIDKNEGVIRYASSGATPPIFIEKGGDEVVITPGDPTGLPLGIVETTTYAEHVIPIPKDGHLFLYSDVMLEQRGEKGGHPLAISGLVDLVQETVSDESQPDALNGILARFQAFAGTTYDDDLSAVWIDFDTV